MASVNDIGVPGTPMAAPPLTAWQDAVRDALNGSDVPVNSRLAESDTWTSWVPTITGGTVSASDCRYRRTRGGLFTINASLTIATVTGALAFSIPVAAMKQAVGNAYMVDANGGSVPGMARIGAGATTCNVWPFNAAGTYATIAVTSATVPFTWEAGDSIHVNIAYQCVPLP